jgi:hypothetical protein
MSIREKIENRKTVEKIKHKWVLLNNQESWQTLNEIIKKNRKLIITNTRNKRHGIISYLPGMKRL